ncbi:MAG TPA: TetR/AcrR family transcriptional regulator [Actinomycetes bacterium]|nr:TetR/AcrR family transcriptional regulator [Actinomycetes bacterium]
MSAIVEEAERRVLDLRATPKTNWGTKDRILLAASQLFALHGFRGASTRAIAEQVGVRQPSLFKHFDSKREMLGELAVFDMHVPAAHAQRAAAGDGPATDRLAAYLAWDFEWYRTMPFDLRGMTVDLVKSEGLTDAQRAVGKWTRAIRAIMKQGVESGEFVEGSVRFVPPVIETISWHMVHSSNVTGKTVDDGVRFVLAAVIGR